MGGDQSEGMLEDRDENGAEVLAGYDLPRVVMDCSEAEEHRQHFNCGCGLVLL